MCHYQCSPIPPDHQVSDFTYLFGVLQKLKNTIVKSLVVCCLIISIEHA